MKDKGKGRWLLRNDDGVVLKKSYNAQILKWLKPTSGLNPIFIYCDCII